MEQSLSCQHHWIIEAATGPTSNGVCQVCGAEWEFRNSTDENLWSQQSRKARAARAAAEPGEDTPQE